MPRINIGGQIYDTGGASASAFLNQFITDPTAFRGLGTPALHPTDPGGPGGMPGTSGTGGGVDTFVDPMANLAAAVDQGFDPGWLGGGGAPGPTGAPVTTGAPGPTGAGGTPDPRSGIQTDITPGLLDELAPRNWSETEMTQAEFNKALAIIQNGGAMPAWAYRAYPPQKMEDPLNPGQFISVGEPISTGLTKALLDARRYWAERNDVEIETGMTQAQIDIQQKRLDELISNNELALADREAANLIASGRLDVEKARQAEELRQFDITERFRQAQLTQTVNAARNRESFERELDKASRKLKQDLAEGDIKSAEATRKLQKELADAALAEDLRQFDEEMVLQKELLTQRSDISTAEIGLQRELGEEGFEQQRLTRELQKTLGLAGIEEQGLARQLQETLGLAGIEQQGLTRELQRSLGFGGIEQEAQDRALRETLGLGGFEQQGLDRALMERLGLAGVSQQREQAALQNPFAFTALSTLGGFPSPGTTIPQGQGSNPFLQGLSGLNFQVPQGVQAGQATSPREFFPTGTPTIGSLSQTDPESLRFLSSILGFTGTSPEQFGRRVGSVTPATARA
jgi:hypothetical protein